MGTPLTLSRTIAVACVVLVAASCGGTVASGAPSDPLERTVDAGLVPAQKEFLINHVHSHLDASTAAA